jgi:dolichyl-phosphate-mannose-protein mannosyltransferase
MFRIEAVSVRYGPIDGPPWARLLEARVVPISRALHPPFERWGRIEHPYVGGDPVNYLASAREMKSFYQPNVREPMFLAITRLCLWAAGGRDIAVSLASAAASILAIYATWLLGTAAFSPWVGLGAALCLAIEPVAIDWSSEGWRDDTFTLFVTLAAWRLVRLARAPDVRNAIAAGVACGAAALTRITALSFVLPALVWVIAAAPAAARRAATKAALACAATAAVLVAPYLVACAREFGDPLYALDYHTRYYRAAESLDPDPAITAKDYVLGKLKARPIATLDTAAIGVFVWPFTVKWRGFTLWSIWLYRILWWSALAGLLMFLWSPEGRLLLVILCTAVLPYCLTWNVGGGGEWRFTAHVYPIYLVAATFALETLVRSIVEFAPRQTMPPVLARARVARVAAVGVTIVVACAAYYALPLFITREALAGGEAAMIQAGDRDRVYFTGPWSAPEPQGNVTVRAALGTIVSIRVPVPQRREYLLTLRLDPAETADPQLQPKVTVYMNGQVLAQLHLARDPSRVGTYRMRIPPSIAGRTFGRLDLVSSHTVAASDAGPRFDWLPADAHVAFRFWYLRLEPVA